MERLSPRRISSLVITLALAAALTTPALAQVCDEPAAAPPEPVKPNTSVVIDEAAKAQS